MAQHCAWTTRYRIRKLRNKEIRLFEVFLPRATKSSTRGQLISHAITGRHAHSPHQRFILHSLTEQASLFIHHSFNMSGLLNKITHKNQNQNNLQQQPLAPGQAGYQQTTVQQTTVIPGQQQQAGMMGQQNLGQQNMMAQQQQGAIGQQAALGQQAAVRQQTVYEYVFLTLLTFLVLSYSSCYCIRYFLSSEFLPAI